MASNKKAAALRQRRYNARHPAKVIARNKQYYAKNRKKILKKAQVYHVKNRKKKNQHSAQYYVKNKKAVALRFRKRSLVRLYGITHEQYEEIAKVQKQRCAICKNKENGKRMLAVDHDHDTGRIRGLLCSTCNNHLGIYERKKELFEAYLRGSKV